MATLQSISTNGTPTKTAVDARTDSQWWYFVLAGAPVAVESSTSSTTAISLASAFR